MCAMPLEETAKISDMTLEEDPEICIFKTRECKHNTCILLFLVFQRGKMCFNYSIKFFFSSHIFVCMHLILHSPKEYVMFSLRVTSVLVSF